MLGAGGVKRGLGGSESPSAPSSEPPPSLAFAADRQALGARRVPLLAGLGLRVALHEVLKDGLKFLLRNALRKAPLFLQCQCRPWTLRMNSLVSRSGSSTISATSLSDNSGKIASVSTSPDTPTNSSPIAISSSKVSESIFASALNRASPTESPSSISRLIMAAGHAFVESFPAPRPTGAALRALDIAALTC